VVHVQPHRHTGEFDDGVTHGVVGTLELVSPSRLKLAAEDACAVQYDRIEAGAIFNPQSAISSRATHGCFSLSTKGIEKLRLKKLNFQVLRRTIATLAQSKGSVKDVQEVLGHAKADTTANVYMQPIEEGVKQTLDAIYAELTARPKLVKVR
jgi:hypothetical protein